MKPQPVFRNRFLPYLLILPQLAITGIFFFWPAGVALYQSLLRTDPFGLRSKFVGMANFVRLFSDPYYLHSVKLSFWFSFLVTFLAMGLALLFAVMASKPIRGAKIYRTLFVWPYAVAPATAAVLWVFLFQPEIGLLGRGLKLIGVHWNYYLNATQALALVILVSVWKQISYNFIFFLAGPSVHSPVPY
jgi:ABC-type sugar transport systems, permease components